MNISLGLSAASIDDAIKKIDRAKKQLKAMNDEFLEQCCEWVKTRANLYLDLSGLNSGFINEIKRGWQTPTKQDGSYVLTNHGRGYSVEFGIGIIGQGSYEGDFPDGYEYNVDSTAKLSDGSWIFRVQNIETLDIKEENVMPRANTGEIVYEEGRTIRTKGQKAVMFCYHAIVDFCNEKAARSIWENIKKGYWG